MTLINAQTRMLALAIAAAARGGKADDSSTDELQAAVAEMYPTEAAKFARAADLLAEVAHELAGTQAAETVPAERQRAADRVTDYLDRRERLDALDRPEGVAPSDVVTSTFGSVALLASDLRLLVEAAPSLPPKWSAPLADPQVHIVQQGGKDWTNAAAHAREVLSALEAQGPEAYVFDGGMITLSVADLETLCDLNGDILFVTFDEARAMALVDNDRTTLSTTSVHR